MKIRTVDDRRRIILDRNLIVGLRVAWMGQPDGGECIRASILDFTPKEMVRIRIDEAVHGHPAGREKLVDPAAIRALESSDG